MDETTLRDRLSKYALVLLFFLLASVLGMEFYLLHRVQVLEGYLGNHQARIEFIENTMR